MVLESKFQADLIVELKERFPGCMVVKNDPTYLQGFPDLLILWRRRWAALEVKASMGASLQPNQEWYVDKLDAMSYANFICPENKEKILDEIQRSFRTGR